MEKREEFLFSLFFYIFVLSLICISNNSFSQNQTINNFSKSKKNLLNIHKNNPYTFYCSCSYRNKTPNLNSCGYKIYKNFKRANRIEFEHIVPASRFGKKFLSWQKGHIKCIKNNGKRYNGRKCSKKVDENFRLIEADMYNLQPTIGEINQLRENFKMSIISGEQRFFGKCDIEIKNNKIEPTELIRGDIARTYLYMSETYPSYISLSKMELDLFNLWDSQDPVDEWECKRYKLIKKIQKNENHILANKCFTNLNQFISVH